MLKRSRQVRFFGETGVTALEHLDAFCRTRDGEELHKFRVAVKRLQALILILKGHPEDEKLMKSFQPVRMIYKKAGAIRLMDVHKEMMSGVSYIKPSFVLKISRLRDKEASIFISSCKTFKLKLETGILKISKQLFDVESRFIIKKYRKQLKKIAFVLSGNIKDIKALHKARKKIKMLTYTYILFPKSITSEIHLDKKYLNRLEHMIGDWHDIVQTSDVLKGAGITNPYVFQKLKLQEQTAQQRFGKLAKGFLKKVKG